jgi:very-short-patch-repair endonuclease
VLLDHAWRQRLIDGPYLHDLASRSGGRGRSGIVVLRQVLDTRPPDYRPAGSRLEERFEEIVSPVVRSELRRQVTVDVEPVIRTVDHRLDRWPLIVEVNGEAWHTSLTDRAADAERYERMLELGFSVVVFWEYDVWHDHATVRRSLDHLLLNPDPVPTLHRPTPAPWDC